MLFLYSLPLETKSRNRKVIETMTVTTVLRVKDLIIVMYLALLLKESKECFSFKYNFVLYSNSLFNSICVIFRGCKSHKD